MLRSTQNEMIENPEKFQTVIVERNYKIKISTTCIPKQIIWSKLSNTHLVWMGLENIDFCFCINFDKYYQFKFGKGDRKINSGTKTSLRFWFILFKII